MRTILPLLIILVATPVMGEEATSTPVCWPLHFAGITLGVNTDQEVQRILGKGFVPVHANPAGERYYVDTKKSSTMHILSYTDSIVAEITVQEGITLKPEEVSSAISSWFNPMQGFGKWRSLHLGSTKDEVKSNLGNPVKGSTANAWRYDSSCACEIEVYFTVYFNNDRIYKVVFSAPHG